LVDLPVPFATLPDLETAMHGSGASVGAAVLADLVDLPPLGAAGPFPPLGAFPVLGAAVALAPFGAEVDLATTNFCLFADSSYSTDLNTISAAEAYNCPPSPPKNCAEDDTRTARTIL